MNTTFKSKKNTLLLLAAAILIPAMIPGCRKPVEDKEFRNSKEAIDVCRTNLYRLRNTPDADVKELASEINTWVNLKEKAVSVIMNEITTEYNGDSIDENTLEMALAPRREFTGIEDSTRSEITRLLSLPKWQLRDIVTIKQLTAKNQWQDLKEVEIRDAQDFYEKMDQIPAYQDLDLMLQTYDSLLSNTPAFEKEGQLYAFIREEDRCFRTLMDHLYEIPDETLQTLAEQTSSLVDNLYSSTSENMDNDVNKRVMLYLTMRFNRRIIQNAMACSNDILMHRELTQIQAANYRWMLIQPLVTIDSQAMAALTDLETHKMKELAANLPLLLAMTDGIDIGQNKEELDKLEKRIFQYIISFYISLTL